MGLFDRFTKSFEDEVQEALEKIRGMNLGVKNLSAKVDGKVVTLTGMAPTKEVKFKVMELFGGMVKADNVLNTLTIEEVMKARAEAAAVVEEQPTERIHEVVSGDTLGAIAKRYYGKSGLYPKIFEANRDILDNPDLIKVGQKLRIPE